MNEKTKSPERSLILSVFAEDPAGITIFEWLTKAHYNITSFSEDPYRTAFNEGRRYVIQTIINEMWKKTEEEIEEEEFLND